MSNDLAGRLHAVVPGRNKVTGAHKRSIKNESGDLMMRRRGDLIVKGVLGDQQKNESSGRSTHFQQHELMELRFRGMQAVRFEFIVRLMQLKIEIYTLSVYWEDGRNFMRLPALQRGSCKLVYASTVRITREFDDNSLRRYIYDREIKALVDAELDCMVTAISNSYGVTGVETSQA